MKDQEIEVKFFLSDPAGVRNRLVGLGAEFISRNFETNLRFEDAANSLIQRKTLLRLRRDDRTTLTFKSPPAEEDPEFKVHTEWEVEVSDFATMQRILNALGFKQAQVYEKWRETYHFAAACCCIDTLPFGTFLEIEGARRAIRETARQLGFGWQDRIVLNYLALFEIIQKAHALPFSDVTFENFSGFDTDFLHSCVRF